MDITKASFDDIHHVLPLIMEYYEYDRPDVNMEDSYLIEHVSAMLHSDSCAVYAALEQGEVVGVAGLSIAPNYGKLVAQEVFWKIASSHTKSKIGSHLLRALEDHARLVGADSFNVVALAGEHEKRVGNSYISRGYEPICSTYTKALG